MRYTFRHIALAGAMLLALALPDAAAAADCFADYKAKKDNPLKLHYGVVQLRQDCSKDSARSEIAKRIRRDGWTLLNVLSVFDASQLSGKESSAGHFYLRY
ncbi:hypothetical protein [Shimia sp.]|uniref:hypothetical protein n=1 Tax=Shimia sp. TaxID=1954381 RepID=UPI003297B89B